jgi:hypothetical protein
MATQEILYKIQDTSTKLYSTGGYQPNWTKDGKTWKTKAQLVAHLKLYKRGQYAGESKVIPATWAVVELRLTPVKKTRATTLVK